MKSIKIFDGILNVFIPIVLGYFIYSSENIYLRIAEVKNYLPDALWAYAFVSFVLIVWNRHINFFWLSIVCLISIIFELFQYFHLVKGTGDPIDVIVYFFSIIIGLLGNKYFKNKHLKEII